MAHMLRTWTEPRTAPWLQVVQHPSFQLLASAALRRAAAGRGEACCEVSGAPQSLLQLHTVPAWRYDYTTATVRLLGAVAVCAPVAAAKLLHMLPTPDERGAALELVAAVNGGWTVSELDAFVGFVNGRRYLLGAAGSSWAMDASLLDHAAAASTPPA
jgi:hypothetical protein